MKYFGDVVVIEKADEINNNLKEEFVKKLHVLAVCTKEERNSLSKEFGTRWPFDVTFEGNAHEIIERFSKYAKNDLNSGRFAYIQCESPYGNRITMNALKSSKDSVVLSEIIKIGQDNYRYWHGVII
jgi:hypothetical protein